MSALGSFMAIKFVKLITTPFEKWKAFELGLIDKSGKKIREAKTTEEKREFEPHINIVRNLKRLIESLPGGKSKLSSIVAAYYLIKESTGANLDIDLLFEEIELEDELFEECRTTNTLDFINTPLRKVGIVNSLINMEMERAIVTLENPKFEVLDEDFGVIKVESDNITTITTADKIVPL